MFLSNLSKASSPYALEIGISTLPQLNKPLLRGNTTFRTRMSFFKSSADSDSDSDQGKQQISKGKASRKTKRTSKLSTECSQACEPCPNKCDRDCDRHCNTSHHISDLVKSCLRHDSMSSSAENSDDEKLRKGPKIPSSEGEADIPLDEHCSAAHCPLKILHMKGTYGKSVRAVKAGHRELPAQIKVAVEAIATEKGQGKKKATVAEKMLVKKFGKAHEML